MLKPVRVSSYANPFGSEVTLLDLGLDSNEGGDIPSRLHRLFLELKEFCRENGIPLHMNDLTRTLLSFPTDSDYPCGFPG